MGDLDERLARIGAIVVEDRVLRRVIKRHRRLGGIGLQVPHATSYVLAKAHLLPLVEPGEVAIDPELLPERVVVFTEERESLEVDTPEAHTLAWRAVFHARVHDAFDAKLAGGELTTAAIRERVNRIGQTEFDEIRFVLRQADLLLPPHDDATTYAEFVAVYL